MFEPVIIKSTSNPIYKDFIKAREEGKRNGVIFLEGEDLVKMAFSQGALKKTAYLEGSSPLFKEEHPTFFSKGLLRNLSSYGSLPKVIGIASFSYKEEPDGDRIVYLDGLQDPGNLGTIARTALAFSYPSLVLSSDCVSPYNAKSVAASKGSFLSLNIVKMSLEDVKKRGYALIMTSLTGEDIHNVKSMPKKYCLVIGNEGQGIPKEDQKKADLNLYLPIDRSIDSLNAGVAAGIFMYLLKEKTFTD